MPTPTIRTKVAIDGEKEYKQALSEINSGLKVLNSEMKLTSAQFADNADSMEALTAKGDVIYTFYGIGESESNILRFDIF